jgi:hypothetical protein
MVRSYIGSRRYRLEPGEKIGQILVRHQREAVIGKDRIEVPLRPLAVAHCARELLERPAADTGLRMRSDIGGKEGAKGRCECRPAGQRRSPIAGVGVAGDAPPDADEVGAAVRVTAERQVAHGTGHRPQHEGRNADSDYDNKEQCPLP